MIKPLGKRILVKPVAQKQRSEFIVVPEQQTLVREAEVLASGLDEVKVGQRVFILMPGVDTPEGLLIAEVNVLAVIE